MLERAKSMTCFGFFRSTPSTTPQLLINTQQQNDEALRQQQVISKALLSSLQDVAFTEPVDEERLIIDLKKYVQGRVEASSIKFAISNGKDEFGNELPPNFLPTLSLLSETHLNQLKNFLQKRADKTGFFSPYQLMIKNGIPNTFFITIAATVTPYILIGALAYTAGSQYIHQQVTKQRANEILNDIFRLEVNHKAYETAQQLEQIVEQHNFHV